MRTVPYALSAVLLLATACGGGGKQGAAPASTIQAPVQAPIAKAGPNQVVSSGATVALDGSATTDPAGLPLSYGWTAPAGITLSAPSAVRPSFTAPTFAPGLPPMALVFTLVVSNGLLSSNPATVTITVNAPPLPNPAPIAGAGPDQAVSSGATVALDGSASTDSAGLPLTYAWTAPAGSTLSAVSVARPTFTAPILAPGAPPVALAFTLVVSNGQLSSSPASVTITVNAPPLPNPAPIAHAGTNQAVLAGATVTLDGSLSADPDGEPLSFAWTAPAGASITLTGAATAHPTFVAPAVPSGSPPVTLTFTLVVSDAHATSVPATVSVTVSPSGAVVDPAPPGTPTPAPPDPNPVPLGGSGSKRWQIGAVGGGLYLADPAAGEASVQGLVIVTLDKGVPPADTVVTINGVALNPAPPSDGRYFKVDPNGPQPPVHPGGRMVLAASSASAGVDRKLVLPCASDVAVVSSPAMGASLAGMASLQLAFPSDLTLNPAGIPALAGTSPVATLEGYDPTTRALTAGSPHAVGAGQLGLSLPVGTTSARVWLVDLRWPGVFIPDGGDSGAFCGIVKRWVHTK